MERPVIVSRVSNTPMPYRVVAGMSVVVFVTLLDAKNYCDKRFKEVKD